MLLALQTLTVLLVAIAMSLSLAHALELPGKLRLGREAYAVVQTIYYPGFTIGGFFGEVLGLVSTLVLTISALGGGSRFWWTLGGFSALVAMHASYWIFIHSVNRFWLKDQPLDRLGGAFFAVNSVTRARREAANDDTALWKQARATWEYAHVLRAVLGLGSLVALTVAVAL